VVIEELLLNDGFLRVSKSTIVNLNMLKSFSPTISGWLEAKWALVTVAMCVMSLIFNWEILLVEHLLAIFSLAVCQGLFTA